jgi:hypothetical protein
MGLIEKLPPQLGHTSLRTFVAQLVQNVHSKEQMKASVESGGKSLSQHSQFGLNASIRASLISLQDFIVHLLRHLRRTPSGQRRATFYVNSGECERRGDLAQAKTTYTAVPIRRAAIA